MAMRKPPSSRDLPSPMTARTYQERRPPRRSAPRPHRPSFGPERDARRGTSAGTIYVGRDGRQTEQLRRIQHPQVVGNHLAKALAEPLRDLSSAVVACVRGSVPPTGDAVAIWTPPYW